VCFKFLFIIIIPDIIHYYVLSIVKISFLRKLIIIHYVEPHYILLIVVV